MYKSMEKVENVFIVFQKTFGEEGKEMSVHKLVKKNKKQRSQWMGSEALPNITVRRHRRG